jgi:predicted MFS family arabinose efflux permease
MPDRRIWSYENGLVLMMSLTNGVVTLDRLAMSFLTPYVVRDFHISNTQVGLLASILSVAVAGSGFLLSSVADATGRRKLILVIMLALFSVCSAFSGLAGGYVLLLLARGVLGFTEGPIAPIAQSVVAIDSSEHRRGLNMGIMLNLGAAVIGMGLGPILATHLAEAFGWRSAFFVSGVPGLLLAMAILAFMRPLRQPPPAAAARPNAGAEGIGAVFRSRNIWLCIVISGLYSAWLIIQSVFLPLFLVKVDGLKPTDMGLVVAATGAASAIAGMAIPALSDRIGRRPALALVALFGMAAPLATLFTPHSTPALALALFIGYFGGGAGPLYIGIIPAESVPPRHVAAAVAIAMASGEIFGGVAGPTLAGWAADLYGLGAPFWISAACAGVSGLLALLLIETAPARVRALAAAA